MASSVSDENIKIVKIIPFLSVGECSRLAGEAKKLSISDVASKLAFTKKTVINLEDEQWDEFHGHAYARDIFCVMSKFLICDRMKC